MQPSLDDLALLVAIADEGGFSAAARALNLPKSTVSRRLSDLEARLSATLFQRSTRALSLTDEGQRAYAIAKPAIDAARDAAHAITDCNSEVTGRVTLTATATIGQYVIAPRLPALIERHPALQIELRLTERRLNIVAEGIDLAVRMGTLDDSDLVARKLTAVSLQLVARPSYLAEHGAPLNLSELAGHRAIVTSHSRARWRFSDGWESEPRWNIAAGNMMVAHQLALAGHGIAMLPDFLIQDDLAVGRLTRILADNLPDQADAWLVSSRQRYRSPAVRVVMDQLCGIDQGSGGV